MLVGFIRKYGRFSRRNGTRTMLYSAYTYNNPTTGQRGKALNVGNVRPNPFSQKPLFILSTKIIEAHGYSWFRHICIRQAAYLKIMQCLNEVNKSTLITFWNGQIHTLDNMNGMTLVEKGFKPKNSNPDNLITFQVRNQSGRLKMHNNIYHVINSISKHSVIKCMPTTKAQLRNQYKILEVICERLLYFYNDFEAVLGLRVETTVKRVRTIVSFYI